MSPALPQPLRDLDVAEAALTALLVGVTLYVLGSSTANAGTAAGFLFLLHLSRDLAEFTVGDYAGNAVLGLFVLTATAYFAALGGPWWFIVTFALCGGWALVDGVQHLRAGARRSAGGLSIRHDGSLVTGLPKALLARLAEPFALGLRPGAG
jgi:hypothetical protein